MMLNSYFLRLFNRRRTSTTGCRPSDGQRPVRSGSIPKLLGALAEPVRRDPAFWLLSTLLMGVAACLSLAPDGTSFHFAKVKFVVGLLQAAAIAWLVALVIIKVRRRSWLRWALLIVASIACVAEMFCFVHLGSRFDTNIVGLILQTDMREAGEFVGQYVMSWRTAAAALLPAAILVLYALPLMRRLRWHTLSAAVAIDLTVVAGFAALIVALWPDLTGGRYIDHLSTPVQIGQAVAGIRSHGPELEQLRITHRHVEPDSVGRRPELIVMVIGESYNKHHASIYGYSLPTTPRMQRELKAGNMAVMTDVVSPSSATAHVMHAVLSTHTPSLDPLPWEQYPLLPAALRSAGYEVCYLDNHATRLQADPWNYSSSYFLNPSDIDSACFDHRNDRVYAYDDGIVDAFAELPQASGPRVVIVHLMGQHSPAWKRYPADWQCFTAADYPDSLTAAQRADIAAYDNAVRYNDHIIGRIIDLIAGRDAVMVYVADHGEEVHDFRNQYGRTQEPTNASIVRNVFEVPMIVWWSPKFASLAPLDTARILAARCKPCLSTDVPQLILDLAAVHASWAHRSRSLIDSTYCCPPRVIGTGYDYDSGH